MSNFDSVRLTLIRRVGNQAAHPEGRTPIRPDVAAQVLRELHHALVHPRDDQAPRDARSSCHLVRSSDSLDALLAALPSG